MINKLFLSGKHYSNDEEDGSHSLAIILDKYIKQMNRLTNENITIELALDVELKVLLIVR